MIFDRLRLIRALRALLGEEEVQPRAQDLVHLTDEELRARFLNAYRRRLAARPAGGPQARVDQKRFARGKASDLARKLRRDERRPVLPKQHLADLAKKFSSSPILDRLYPKRVSSWMKPSERLRRTKSVSVKLERFTFIDEPQKTLNSFRLLAEAETDASSAIIDFEDAFCVDIAPYVVLAEVWPSITKVFTGGKMNLPVQKVVEAVGLRRALGIQFRGGTRDTSGVWAFQLRRRRPSKSSRHVDRELEPQKREEVADQFCDLVDEWLGAHKEIPLELNEKGRYRFSSLITELLDNAERHSEPDSKDGSWSTAAFMARREEGGETVHRCYMAFLSVGASIAESLTTASARTRDDIDKYTASHVRRGQSVKTLATLVALQDGISRDAKAEGADRGGIGFQEVLDFISTLGVLGREDRDPRMTIVSGSSCIKLRTPYLQGISTEVDGPRYLWCNAANSPDDPPDIDYVFDLDGHFSGTVVGVSFVLDHHYLKATLNDPN